MFGLETIIARNEAAANVAGIRKPQANYRDLIVSTCMGLITITGQKEIEGNWVHIERKVNASNPLLDQDLVDFHRTWDGPKNVAGQVELHASQWRRIVSADGSGLWEECKAQADAINAAKALANAA